MQFFRAYRVHVLRERDKKRHIQAQWNTKRSCVLFLLLFFFCCKYPAQTVLMHMLIWNFVGLMFSWRPSLIPCKSFFYCRYQKPLIRQRRCTCMHMLIYNFVGQIFLGHPFIFHFSFLLWQKTWHAHISLTFFFCKDPDQTVWVLTILCYQTSLIPHSTWDNK